MSNRKSNAGRHQLQQRMQAFEAKCRQANLKITPQRTAIYRELLKSTEHPSADVLYKKVKRVFPSISLDTVNRTLLTLNEIGVAFVVEGSGDVKRFDGNLNNHQHFKCVRCKRIVDFHHKPFDNISIPKNLGDGFEILRKTVYFEGICNLCSKNKKRKGFKSKEVCK